MLCCNLNALMRRRHENEQRKRSGKKYELRQERLERMHSKEEEEQRKHPRESSQSGASHNLSNTRREFIADDLTKAGELKINAEMNESPGLNTSEPH